MKEDYSELDAVAKFAPASEPLPMKTWQHDETGRICRLERSPGPRWAEVPLAGKTDSPISAAAPAGEPLRDALEEIHSWLVCWPIASPADMAQSFEAMEKLAREVLAAPAGEPAPVIAWIVHAKGGRFTRGLYMKPNAEDFAIWRADGDTALPLYYAPAPVAAPAGEPAPIDMVLHCQGEDQ